MTPLASARIVLGVSGGIAAYKAADLASRLVQSGATVDVVLTAGAQEFVRPLTFSALTQRTVHTDPFALWTDGSTGHVSLARDADALLVAPASANTIVRLALGFADDLLGAVALSTTAPLLLAPAMEHGMFHHPATQAHLATLRERGAIVVGPDPGRLASGAVGDGRLATAEAILGALRATLGRDGPLAGRRLVVTAGGTREPLDPVRFLGNRSSGTMGYAIAAAAVDRGATVELISGPVALAPPANVALVRVETAEQMRNAVEWAAIGADALVMVAAVADFRPASPSDRKIKKSPGGDGMTLDLVRNPDIVGDLDGAGLLKVGFAAETDDLLANAAAKLEAKGLAMIVANDAVAAIDRPTSRVTILRPGVPPEPLPDLPKERTASLILDRLVALLDKRRDAETSR